MTATTIAEIGPGQHEQTGKNPEGDPATVHGLCGQPGEERGDGNDLQPDRRVHERVGEDDGQHRERPSARDIEPPRELGRPHGHRRRQRDGQDPEPDDGPERAGHRR